MELKHKALTIICSVLIGGLTAGLTNIVSPAIATIAAAYPDLPLTTISLVSTLPQLIAIPAAILFGALAGRVIGWKTLSLVALAIVGIFGVLPATTDNFTLILVYRALYGIGYGGLVGMWAGLITALFDGSLRGRVMGIASLAMGGFGIVIPTLAGYLVSIRISAMWMGHLLAAVVFVMVLFMDAPPMTKKADQQEAAQTSGPKARIPWYVWMLIVFYFLANVGIYPFMLYNSTIVMNDGLGTPVIAGLMLSCYFVGMMIGGFLFPNMHKALKSMVNPVGILFAMPIGTFIFAWSYNIYVMFFACVLMGFGMGGMYNTGINAEWARVAPPSRVAIISAIAGAAPMLSGFCAPYFVQMIGTIFAGSDMRFAIIVCGITGLILAAIMAALVVAYNKQEKRQDAQLQDSGQMKESIAES